MYNIDNSLAAYITNSTYSSQLILSGRFKADTGIVDITRYVTAGTNTITFLLTNTLAGYTWGWEFYINGTLQNSNSCGTVNVAGCNNNDQTLFTHRDIATLGGKDLTFPVSTKGKPVAGSGK